MSLLETAEVVTALTSVRRISPNFALRSTEMSAALTPSSVNLPNI